MIHVPSVVPLSAAVVSGDQLNGGEGRPHTGQEDVDPGRFGDCEDDPDDGQNGSRPDEPWEGPANESLEEAALLHLGHVRDVIPDAER